MPSSNWISWLTKCYSIRAAFYILQCRHCIRKSRNTEMLSWSVSKTWGRGLRCVRVRVRVSVDSNPNFKTAFFFKKDITRSSSDPDSAFYWHPLSCNYSIVFSRALRQLTCFCPVLRCLNTVLAIHEYVSFAKSWQAKGCSSQAETWQVKNTLIKSFDWQVKFDVFVVSMAT